MSTIESVIFTVLLAIAVIFFLKRIYTLFALVLLGQGENRFDRLWKRLKDMLLFGFIQKRVVERAFGFNHFFLFWGFIVLLVINIEFVLAGMFPRFSFAFLGDAPYAVLRFLADIMSFVVLLAIIFAFIRRISDGVVQNIIDCLREKAAVGFNEFGAGWFKYDLDPFLCRLRHDPPDEFLDEYFQIEIIDLNISS